MNQFCCCISFLKQIMMKKKTKNRLQPKVKHRLNISSYFRRERSIFGAKMYRRKQHHLHMCWRLQRIEQQTVSQQSSCSRKPQDKQSSHFVRMWQLAGYRRCQKDVSQQNLMFLLLLTKTYTEQIDVTFLRLSCWKTCTAVRCATIICAVHKSYLFH